MKRLALPGLLVVVALWAVGLKLRALRLRPPPTQPGAAAATSAQARSVIRSLGAGPPPGGELGSHGASMIHGDPRHTHRAAGRAPTTTPRLVWAHDVGGAVEAQVTASADQETLYVASLGGALIALAERDGSERWRASLGDRAYTTPCVARDGTIYVGTDAKKFDAFAPDGTLKWSFETDGDADTGPTVVEGGDVVFAAGRTVYSVAAATGQARWRFAAKRKVYTAPAVASDGRVFFGSQDHHAYALSARGALLWSVDLGADVDGAPAIGDDGALFVGTDDDEVVRIEPDAGAVVWRARVGGYVRGTLAVARNGDVLAGVYGPTPREIRVRAADGAVVGELPIQGTGAREFGVHGGALEDEAGTLLFGTQDDAVYAVGADGSLLWRFLTGGDVDAPVTLLDDRSVVLASDDGKVYLLR